MRNALSRSSRGAALCSALALFLVGGCVASTPSPRPAPKAVTSDTSNFGKGCVASNGEAQAVRELKAKIHSYTTSSRRRLGAGALQLKCEGGLTVIADSHSEWMARAKKMSHRNGQGQEAHERVTAHYPGYQGLVAENLGVITTTYRGSGARARAANYSFNPDEMAKNFVDGWLNSPGHRKNLLHPRMTHLGVGVAVRGTSVYVTQVFADPLN